MHDPPGHCRVKDSLEHLSPSDSLMYNPPGHCRVIRFTGMFYLCHSHSCTIHLAPPVSESLLKGDSFELSDKTGDRNWNFVKEIQTHERFKRMQFIRTKHRVNFQGNPLHQATKQYVVKQQLKGEKWWKVRWRGKPLYLFLVVLCRLPVQCLEEEGKQYSSNKNR